jgi:hypothetical protein
MCFLYRNECRIFKPAEITNKKTKVERKKWNEPTWYTIHIHMKCYNETSCIDILNKQICPFSKTEGQESKTGPVWRLVQVGVGRI